MVTKIMGYGTGHPANGGKTIRLQELAMCAPELIAHSVKGQRELADLCSAIHAKLVIKIASTEGAGAGDQGFERPGYGAGDGNRQHQPNEQGRQAKGYDPPVYAAKVFAGAIVGLENHDLNLCLPSGRESGGCRDVGLSGQLQFLWSRSPIES